MAAHDPRLLATAIEAVVRAGEMQMASFGRAVQVHLKGEIDLVTEVDLAVEQMFRTLIAERFPGHDVLAEEGGQSGGDSTHRWVFDPIDGTTNYAHGIPIFCAALAVEIAGVPEVAAIYDPNRRELFTAERGTGAWLNGVPLRVSSTAVLGDAVLVTGFPYDVREPQRLQDIMAMFSALIGEARAVRRLGSAALDLCWTAAGRMDAFWEQSLHPWDVMGGALIVEAAGGRVSALDGSPWSAYDGNVAASNGHVHDEMLAVVARVRRR